MLTVLYASIFNLPKPSILFQSTGDSSTVSTSAGNLANFVLNFLTALALPLAVAGIIYSAYIMIVSSGNPDAYTKAKKNLLYIVGGIFLIVFAATIVSSISGLFNKA